MYFTLLWQVVTVESRYQPFRRAWLPWRREFSTKTWQNLLTWQLAILPINLVRLQKCTKQPMESGAACQQSGRLGKVSWQRGDRTWSPRVQTSSLSLLCQLKVSSNITEKECRYWRKIHWPWNKMIYFVYFKRTEEYSIIFYLF